METRSLLFGAVVVACVALSGCATTMSPSGERFNCNQGACKVPIHIANCAITAPDIEVVGQSRNIFWEIDHESAQNGYKFPDIVSHLGVWIKDDPKGEFEDPKRQNDTTFKLHDKNSDAGKGSYRYGVRVVKGSTVCPDLDPFIVNN